MYMNDEDLLLEFQHKRRIQPQTLKGYKDALRIYTKFNDLPFTELLEEAKNEEMEGIRWADRTLLRRLEEFRTYLYDNYAKKTAKIHFSRIKTIYLHYYIEIHQLPPIRSEDTEPPITYKDLPTKEILRKALNISEPMIRALIEIMIATGCAKKEVRHITFQDVIDGTYSYHHQNNLIDVVNTLKDRNDVIITFHLKRFKTGKWFYTFAHPEATSALLDYLVILLNNYPNIQPRDRIFNINKDYFNNYFKEINDALGLGKVRNYNRFTSHMLRRYHASTLLADGVDKDTVNTLQGKGQNPTDEAYFKVNPQKLKEKYVEHMQCLYVNFNIQEVKPEEIIKLEKEMEEKDRIISEYSGIIRNIDERLKNLEDKNSSPLSDEEFDDLFS